MKQKKILLYIFLLALINFNSFSDIKELPLIEDYNKEFLNNETNKNTKSSNNIQKGKNKNNKKEIKENKEDIKNSKKDSEFLENTNSSEQNDNIKLEDIVDIYEKRLDGKIVYRMESDIPFTGIFGYVDINRIKFYEHYKDGQLDGETVWYNDKGVKMISEYYTKGKLDGIQKTFYDNGKLKSIVKYSNNKVEGVVNYDKNGKVVFKDSFKNGTGKWKFYWTNGNIYEDGAYLNYKKNGVWTTYREDGSVDNIKQYKNGSIIKESWK